MDAVNGKIFSLHSYQFMEDDPLGKHVSNNFAFNTKEGNPTVTITNLKNHIIFNGFDNDIEVISFILENNGILDAVWGIISTHIIDRDCKCKWCNMELHDNIFDDFDGWLGFKDDRFDCVFGIAELNKANYNINHERNICMNVVKLDN